MNAAAGLAGQAFRDLLDQREIIALAHGSVEIDELDQRVFGKFFDPVFEIIKGEAKFFALHKLDDAATQ
jgi:hypothetical protein